MHPFRKFFLASFLLVFSVCTVAGHITPGGTYDNDWQSVKLDGLNLIRLEVPGGWLVREGLGKFLALATGKQTRMIVFVPDPDHAWMHEGRGKWRTLKLKGLNLYRLRTPQGWLVREGIGKIGDEHQLRMITYVDDPGHTWRVRKK